MNTIRQMEISRAWRPVTAQTFKFSIFVMKTKLCLPHESWQYAVSVDLSNILLCAEGTYDPHTIRLVYCLRLEGGTSCQRSSVGMLM